MRITTKTLTTAALLCLFVGAGGAAYAGTRPEGFDATIPRLQQPWESSSQGKERPYVAGGLHVATVGSRYTVNARMCGALIGAGCGAEQFDLSGGRSVPLDGPFGYDAVVHLELHTHGFNAVRVEATGDWRSN